MIHIKNILHIIYCFGNLNFLYKYFYNIIFGRKVFKKNIAIKEKFEKEINELKSQKYLSGLEKQNINYNIPFLYEVLKNYNYTEKSFNGLVIGCFEGHSTLFFLMYTKKSTLFCVDNWDQSKLINYSLNAEGFFDKNVSLFENRVVKFKETSENFFEKNDKVFDFVYIDGSHLHVKHDCINSFKILRSEGLMIINSIFWRGFKQINKNNLSGIISFLRQTKNYQILLITRNTLIIKKI